MRSLTNAYSSVDRILLMVTLALMLWGVLAVASASYFISVHNYHWGEHYLYRQIIHAILAAFLALVAYSIPMKWWQNLSPFILFVALILLALVLVPGIGRAVNGSYRWINILGINIQVSELAKLSLIIYLSGYIARKQTLIQSSLMGVVTPLLVIILMGTLVILEPDFGGLFLVSVIGFSMLFFAGLPWQYVVTIVGSCLVAFLSIAVAAPYRLARITSFFNPWENPYGDSYQLTQSLMAIGKGGLWGVGIGHGLQKQLYLPEAHTDFIYAVQAEEIGILGCLMFIILFVVLLSRCFLWICRAAKQGHYFESMFLYGLMVYWGCSMLFSVGVNIGLVPTKGIALPFISYGGSNLLVNACAVGIFLRITKDLSGSEA